MDQTATLEMMEGGADERARHYPATAGMRVSN